jgi:hypothetical protein
VLGSKQAQVALKYKNLHLQPETDEVVPSASNRPHSWFHIQGIIQTISSKKGRAVVSSEFTRRKRIEISVARPAVLIQN